MRGNQYTKEFKDSTVQLALNSEKSVLKIGADLDVNPKTIYNWIREYKVENNIKIDSRKTAQTSTAKETINDENKRLRAENKTLNQHENLYQVYSVLLANYDLNQLYLL